MKSESLTQGIVAAVLASFVVAALSGCATSFTTGKVNPETGELVFKSKTSAVTQAAVKNAKTIEFLVETAGGTHVEATGKSDTTAEANAAALVESVSSLTASVGQLAAAFARYMATQVAPGVPGPGVTVTP